jgi:hypothetical protein
VAGSSVTAAGSLWAVLCRLLRHEDELKTKFQSPLWDLNRSEGFVPAAGLPAGRAYGKSNIGNDFGTVKGWGHTGVSSNTTIIEEQLATLEANGVQLVYWHLFFDGRTIRWADDDTALGFSEKMQDDLRVALRLLQKHKIRVVFALIDFHWFREKAVDDSGAKTGGRAAALANTDKREAFITNVIEPMLDIDMDGVKVGRHPAIAGWNLFNEPENLLVGYEDVVQGLGIRFRAYDLKREIVPIVHDLAANFRARSSQPYYVASKEVESALEFAALTDDAGQPLLPVLSFNHYVPSLLPSTSDLRQEIERRTGRPEGRPFVINEIASRTPSNPSLSWQCRLPDVSDVFTWMDRMGYQVGYPWNVFGDDYYANTELPGRIKNWFYPEGLSSPRRRLESLEWLVRMEANLNIGSSIEFAALVDFQSMLSEDQTAMRNLVETDLAMADANVEMLVKALEQANARLIIAHEAVQKAPNKVEAIERQKSVDIETANIKELTTRLDNANRWRERVMARKHFYFGDGRAGYFARMLVRIEKLQEAFSHPKPATQAAATPKIKKVSWRYFFCS